MCPSNTQLYMLYTSTCTLHTSTIITKSSCLTDRHTLWYIIMDHPVCVARVYHICLTMWTKNCSANKTKRKYVRHWNEVKKKKELKSRFIARLRSTLSRTCCSVCLISWEFYTVNFLCSLYGTTIPDSELLRQSLLISIILS